MSYEWSRTMSKRVVVTFVKNVNCDIETSIEIDLEKNNLTVEELINNIYTYNEEDTEELEDYLYKKLEGDYDNECVKRIYETNDFEIDSLEFEERKKFQF